MSSISSVSGTSTTYAPAPTRPTAPAKPVLAPVADRDHDGDTDGPGVDVKG